MNPLTDGGLAQPLLADSDRSDCRRGLVALRDGDLDQAVALLRQAVQAHPRDTGMRRNLVRALLANSQFEQVVAEASHALISTPDDAELHYALGTALAGTGQPVRACSAFSRSIALRPDHAPSWLNFGNVSVDMDDNASAEVFYRTAIRFDPTVPEAHASLGYVLTLQGRLAEAIAACEAAIRLRPDFARAHMNLATAALLGGDLARGFAAYEWRKRIKANQQDFPPLDAPAWDGGDVRGRTILIRGEQGFGDTIQCARYLPLIRDAGGRPVLACAAPLLPLIRSMAGIQAIPADGPLPVHDAYVDLMSLPHMFGTTLDSIPFPNGYLSAEPSRVLAWQARLASGRKIGVALSGNPRHPADRRRSVPVEQAGPLLAVPGISFVNLQYGPAADTLGLPNLTAWMADYAETAALVANLDLVITVDTSIAHLAGALGKPTWVLLPFAPDWRWMLERTDSPWYSSVRLFRQFRAGDWSGVLDAVIRLVPCGLDRP
ncbi:MAG: tetratricopeptide repeat protein [Rhodopila sp.]